MTKETPMTSLGRPLTDYQEDKSQTFRIYLLCNIVGWIQNYSGSESFINGHCYTLTFPYVASGPAHWPTSEVSGASVEDLWAYHEQGASRYYDSDYSA